MRPGLAVIMGALGISSAASAQGTGTVASPVIKPGAAISLAGGYAMEDGEDGIAHRVEYQRAISESLRLRALVFFNDRGGDYRYRRLALEGMYQFASSDHGWNSAIQIRGRLPDGNDGPGRVRVAWLNRWRPATGPELRLIGLAAHEFGDGRDDGVALETRGEATWQVATGTRAGAQVFNRYNPTTSFGAFDSQRHSVGGVLKGPLSDRLSYRVNALAGISEAAADFELRMRIRLTL
ncbi:MAG: hypothetical protein AAGA89_02050 [Pseudomonadota bacterium]